VGLTKRPPQFYIPSLHAPNAEIGKFLRPIKRPALNTKQQQYTIPET